MNKDITRRAAIGTIISGLAAGPFIIVYLRYKNRKNHDIGLETENYDEYQTRTIFEDSEAQKQLYEEWLERRNEFCVPTAIKDDRISFSMVPDFVSE
jgi:hypothetical protein